MYRLFHDSHATSEDWDGSPLFAYLAWPLAFGIAADSFGRFEASANLFRSRVLIWHDVSREEIEAAFRWWEERSMVRGYEVAGRKYFEINSWEKHQKYLVAARAGRGARCPAPPWNKPAESGAVAQELEARMMRKLREGELQTASACVAEYGEDVCLRILSRVKGTIKSANYLLKACRAEKNGKAAAHPAEGVVYDF